MEKSGTLKASRPAREGEARHEVASTAPVVGLGIVAAVIVGSFFLRMAGAGSSASVQLYLKSLSGEGSSFTSATVGLVYAAFFATELLLSPLFGALSDKVGRKRMMVLGPILGLVAVQLYPFTTLLPVIIVGQMLQGAGTAANVPSSLSYLADITANSPNRSRLMGLFEVASLIGIVAGPASAGYLFDHFGTNAFRILSLLFLIAGAIFWLGLRDVAATTSERRSLRDYVRISTDARLMRFVPAWLMVNAVFAIWTVHTFYLLKAPEGGRPITGTQGQALMGSFTGPQLSQIYLVCGFTFLVGLLFWSFMAGRMRRTTAMLWGLVGTFAMALTLYAINHAYMFADVLFLQPWMLFVLFLTALFVQSAFTPVALAYLADVSEHHPESRGVVMGLYSIFLGVGQLLGSFIGGRFAAAAGVDGLLLATTLAAIIATVNVLLLRRDDPLPSRQGLARASLH
jgi:MFS family permease